VTLAYADSSLGVSAYYQGLLGGGAAGFEVRVFLANIFFIFFGKLFFIDFLIF
jgi:hypothetical protein